MELLKAVFLGFIQGATEFLPVSSSGHLVLGSHLLGFKEQGIVFDVMLHLGTLLSVIIVFRNELRAMIAAPFQMLSGNRSEAVRTSFFWDIYVIIATLPAVIVGLGFKDYIEQSFTSVLVVCLMLIVTGVTMILSRYLADRGRRITTGRSLLIGCAQAAAIMPGLSRSGSTIFTAMLLGVNRETAARFSFIMSIPAILGAAVLNLREILMAPPAGSVLVNLIAGTSMAAVTGYFAIILLLDVIRKNRLPWFGYYCLVIAAVGLMVISMQ
ncbi:MAG: undecaprenyl-diphosphate phosphatase [Desulfocapsaceae bacterium]|nr:undecaprenyl-diphosphate phosphatase [Desulfocapsaceae bacterium]